MGYELHITRKENWHEEDKTHDITLEQWIHYIHSDSEMSLAYPEKPLDGDSHWKRETNTPTINYFSYNHKNGDVTVKNPDHEVIKKMISIARMLNAKVQGDEEEWYDESYFDKLKQTSKKPWWKFW